MRPALGWVRQFARRVGVPRLRGSAHGARPVSNSDDPVSASLRRPTDGAVAGEATTASSRKESLDVAASAVSGGPDGSLLLRPGVDLKRQPSRNALFGDVGEASSQRRGLLLRPVLGFRALGVSGAIGVASHDCWKAGPSSVSGRVFGPERGVRSGTGKTRASTKTHAERGSGNAPASGRGVGATVCSRGRGARSFTDGLTIVVVLTHADNFGA
jgi:hypothetical protein